MQSVEGYVGRQRAGVGPGCDDAARSVCVMQTQAPCGVGSFILFHLLVDKRELVSGPGVWVAMVLQRKMKMNRGNVRDLPSPIIGISSAAF